MPHVNVNHRLFSFNIYFSTRQRLLCRRWKHYYYDWQTEILGVVMDLCHLSSTYWTQLETTTFTCVTSPYQVIVNVRCCRHDGMFCYWFQDGLLQLTVKVKQSKVNVDLYSASTQTPLARSDMDHTVLPANNTISAFTPQSQSITALWLVLIAPTHKGMARLSWPGWLVKLR